MSGSSRLPVLGSACDPTAGPERPAVWPRYAPSSFHVLAKPTGAVCNLDCDYCFYLSKESLYPSGRTRMDEDVLRIYLRQLLESQRSREVTVAWQGGEPTLMGLDFFRRAVDIVRAHRRPGTTVTHTVQTNGVLLDDEWCRFFREHGFLVGLSLDGPRPMHDAYRRDKGRNPTFAEVLRAARRLKRHGVETNILCTVHAANADHPLAVYRFLRDEVGADFLQLIPIVERTTEGVTERSVRPVQWGRFLVSVFDEWLERDVGRAFVQIFEASLASWMGLTPALCIFAETCGDALALEHNGDLYACDHFVELEHRLGNIREARQRAFGRHKRDSLPQFCRTCDVLFACRGECPRNRFIQTPDGKPGLNYLCQGYKAYFRHIDVPMRILASLVRRGEDPSAAYRILQRAQRGERRRPRTKRRDRR
jgi:uncharacterized protein